MDRTNLMRLGGLAGIGVTACILTFAFINGKIGGLFATEVLEGATAEAWLARIHAAPQLAKLGIVLPAFGFTLMLVVGLILFLLIEEKSWQKTLALAGYVTGVPLVVAAFVSATGLVRAVLHPELTTQLAGGLQVYLTFELHHFMLVNLVFGPLFVIVIGNTFMVLAALRAAVLPKWLCIWGIANGAIMVVGILGIYFPPMRIGQIGGPLTMLWFLTTGIVLLTLARNGAKA